MGDTTQIRVHGEPVTLTYSGRGYVTSHARDPRYCLYEQVPEETRCRLRTAGQENPAEWKVEMAAAEKRLIARLRMLGRGKPDRRRRR